MTASPRTLSSSRPKMAKQNLQQTNNKKNSKKNGNDTDTSVTVGGESYDSPEAYTRERLKPPTPEQLKKQAVARAKGGLTPSGIAAFSKLDPNVQRELIEREEIKLGVRKETTYKRQQRLLDTLDKRGKFNTEAEAREALALKTGKAPVMSISESTVERFQGLYGKKKGLQELMKAVTVSSPQVRYKQRVDLTRSQKGDTVDVTPVTITQQPTKTSTTQEVDLFKPTQETYNIYRGLQERNVLTGQETPQFYNQPRYIFTKETPTYTEAEKVKGILPKIRDWSLKQEFKASTADTSAERMRAGGLSFLGGATSTLLFPILDPVGFVTSPVNVLLDPGGTAESIRSEAQTNPFFFSGQVSGALATPYVYGKLFSWGKAKWSQYKIGRQYRGQLITRPQYDVISAPGKDLTVELRGRPVVSMKGAQVTQTYPKSSMAETRSLVQFGKGKLQTINRDMLPDVIGFKGAEVTYIRGGQPTYGAGTGTNLLGREPVKVPTGATIRQPYTRYTTGDYFQRVFASPLDEFATTKRGVGWAAISPDDLTIQSRVFTKGAGSGQRVKLIQADVKGYMLPDPTDTSFTVPQPKQVYYNPLRLGGQPQLTGTGAPGRLPFVFQKDILTGDLVPGRGVFVFDSARVTPAPRSMTFFEGVSLTPGMARSFGSGYNWFGGGQKGGLISTLSDIKKGYAPMRPTPGTKTVTDRPYTVVALDTPTGDVLKFTGRPRDVYKKVRRVKYIREKGDVFDNLMKIRKESRKYYGRKIAQPEPKPTRQTTRDGQVLLLKPLTARQKLSKRLKRPLQQKHDQTTRVSGQRTEQVSILKSKKKKKTREEQVYRTQQRPEVMFEDQMYYTGQTPEQALKSAYGRTQQKAKLVQVPRTSVGVSSLLGQRQRQAQPQKVLLSPQQKYMQRLEQRLRQAQPQQQRQESAQMVRQYQAPGLKQVQLLTPGVRQAQVQPQVSRVTSILGLGGLGGGMGGILPPITSPLPKPPRHPPPTDKRRRGIKRTTARRVPGYDVLVKKYKSKGYHRVNRAPLSKQSALGLGGTITDTFVNRSFKIKSTKKSGNIDPNLARGWSVVRHKYRPSKTNRNIFVEKSQYAIDSAAEKRGIPYKAARLRRAGMIKSKKKRRRIRFI